MPEDVAKLLRDVLGLYETRSNGSLLAPIVRSALEEALRTNVLSLISALTREFSDMFPQKTDTKDGYEKLVNEEVVKYREKLLSGFDSRIPASPAFAAVQAKLQFLTVDGVGRIVDSLLKEGRIAEMGYQNGVMRYVCVDTDREPVAVIPFALTSPITEDEKKTVLGALRGNTYDTLDTIENRLLTLRPHPAVASARSVLFRVLEELVKEGKAIRKLNPTGNVSFWKKPTRSFKKMRGGEWKKRIVEFLDSTGGMRLSSSALISQLQQRYPEADHSRIGSALDRLAKDGKLKRFHRRKIGEKRYEYWTTPIGASPLPLPKNR